MEGDVEIEIERGQKMCENKVSDDSRPFGVHTSMVKQCSKKRK